MTTRPPTIRRLGPPVLVAAMLVAAACEAEPSPPTPEPAAFDGRLLVHTGRPAWTQLFAVDGYGRETEVAVPAGGLRWFAAAPDGRLAGIDGEGRVLVAGPDVPTWRPVAMDEVPGDAEAADVRLPAWSPDGRLAVVFGEAGAATIAGVLIVDPATDGTLWVGLVAGLGGYPPGWLDSARLAVPTRDSGDRPAITVLDVDAGSVGPEIAGARGVAASPDGSTLAVIDDSGAVEVWRPADWLAQGDGHPLERFEPTGPGSVEAVALDRTGDRLAIGVADPDGGTPGNVRVLDGTDGWAVVIDRSMGGAPIGALGFVP
jgi:hypothetical protein